MSERNLIISDFAVSMYSKLTFLLYHLSNEAETIEISLLLLNALFTYIKFENPELNIDRATGLYNQKAFLIYVNNAPEANPYKNRFKSC